jgi:hypothetical protein
MGGVHFFIDSNNGRIPLCRLPYAPSPGLASGLFARHYCAIFLESSVLPQLRGFLSRNFAQ